MEGNMEKIKCRKISVDSVYNDPVDIRCGGPEYLGFDFFVKEAKKLGADYIATGHYAKLKDGYLYKASDENKDQSYFLAYEGECLLLQFFLHTS